MRLPEADGIYPDYVGIYEDGESIFYGRIDQVDVPPGRYWATCLKGCLLHLDQLVVGDTVEFIDGGWTEAEFEAFEHHGLGAPTRGFGDA